MDRVRGFHRGLKDMGFVEDENVSIVYRWADNQIDRMPELVADLIRSRASVLVTRGPPAAFAAKAATMTVS